MPVIDIHAKRHTCLLVIVHPSRQSVVGNMFGNYEIFLEKLLSDIQRMDSLVHLDCCPFCGVGHGSTIALTWNVHFVIIRQNILFLLIVQAFNIAAFLSKGLSLVYFQCSSAFSSLLSLHPSAFLAGAVTVVDWFSLLSLKMRNA